MIRFRDIRSASAAVAYFGKSDGAYYIDGSDLRREVGGAAAAKLGLGPTPDFDQFRHLLNGLHPTTGDQLTAKLIPNRLCGWDVTASIPKGVTVALERGDARIHDAIWEAGRETMADIEAMTTTRVRQGSMDDRVTGNLLWYGFEHPETRPNRSDGMPDPDRHIHFVIPNVTYDPVEDQWKAIKFRPVMDLRKWFDRRFDLRLSSKLTDLGYEIDTRYKPDPTGAKRYFSWGIGGLPESVIKKFSRRGAEVDALAERLGVNTPLSKDRLGATSRLHKKEGLTLDDYRRYWDGRLTQDEKQATAEVIKAAMLGENPGPTNTADKGVAYALSHEFERRSVVPLKELEVTAYERCMGGATPEEVSDETKRQGVLVRGGDATTRAVLAEEQRIIQFARDGRGTMRPMAAPDAFTLANTDHLTLSAEQLAMVNHVVSSPDRVVLTVGDAGTGKTRSIRAAFDAIERPVELLAPSASASRGTLRDEGFSRADTVASFLLNDKRQQAVRNGVIWVDEAGLLAVRDLVRLTDVAKAQNSRLVLQGDPKQHRSVVRHGDMMNVLQAHAGLPVGRLTEIWRQRATGYKGVVADIAAGKLTDGFDKLNGLGWVERVTSNDPLVNDYVEALRTRKPGQPAQDRVLVVAPTHAEGDEITAAIRSRLKADGTLAAEEHELPRLVALNWTEAERADPARYDGTETLCFHRNSGTFKAGDKVRMADWKPTDRYASPAHFSVYRPGTLPVAAGDLVRFTANGKSLQGNRINNGSVYRVAGFDPKGNVQLNNGWTVKSDFGHLAHGYVSTSHASQGRTVDRVLVAMGSESVPAVGAEQFYVSVSRGRVSARVYTDLPLADLREAIQKQDRRRSATDLMAPVRKPMTRRKRFLDRCRDAYQSLRERAVGIIRGLQPDREYTHDR